VGAFSRAKELNMKRFGAYRLALEAVRLVSPLIEKIGRRDRGLSKQASEALNSVPLNIAEGCRARGGNRNLRYDTAMCSAREVIGCLETAEARGYLNAGELPVPIDKLDHVVATLFKTCK